VETHYANDVLGGAVTRVIAATVVRSVFHHQHIIGPIVDVLSPTWIHGLIQAYGLWVIFTLVMLESMGIPMPGETALVTAALYAGSTHQIGIASVVLVAATAAIIGDNIGYLIGRSIGIRLVARYGRYVRLDEPRLKVGQYLFLRHGGKIVFFGRFVSILRTYAAFVAGVSHMEWRRFFAYNAAGGVIWSVAFGLGGYYGQAAFEQLSTPIDIAVGIAAVAAIVWIALLVRRQADRLAAVAEQKYPGPLTER